MQSDPFPTFQTKKEPYHEHLIIQLPISKSPLSTVIGQNVTIYWETALGMIASNSLGIRILTLIITSLSESVLGNCSDKEIMDQHILDLLALVSLH